MSTISPSRQFEKDARPKGELHLPVPLGRYIFITKRRALPESNNGYGASTGRWKNLRAIGRVRSSRGRWHVRERIGLKNKNDFEKARLLPLNNACPVFLFENSSRLPDTIMFLLHVLKTGVCYFFGGWLAAERVFLNSTPLRLWLVTEP